MKSIRGFACVAVGMLAAMPVAAASELRAIVAAALDRSPAVVEARAMLPARAAERRGAARWIRSEPRLSVQTLSDRWDADAGAGEQEYELSAEVWIPGERGAANAEAVARVDLAAAELALAELATAAEVRRAYWDLVLAERLLLVEKDTLALATATRDAVHSLVEAREAAPNDLRLADANAALALADFQRASVAVEAASSALERLSGIARAVGEPEAVPPEEDRRVGARPDVLAAEARAASLRAAAVRAARAPGAAPEVGLVMRRERFERGLPYEQSLGLRVTVPLGTSSGYAGQRLEADARARGAELAVTRARETAVADAASARRSLDLAERAAVLAARREGELSAYLEAVDRARRAGEVSLLELQRARGEVLAARRARVEAEVSVLREMSMQNQAWGRMP